VDKVFELIEVPAALPSGAVASPAPSGAALWMKITLAQRLLNTAAQRFWSRSNLPRIFPSFLLELYSLVSCSVPLLREACERAEELAPRDPLAARTAAYMKQHIEEESHHDEWLLDDLVASGMDRAQVLRRPPSAHVARLVGAQYCWIRHAHPAALFGYLGVIEGNPPLSAHLEEIRIQTGYPPEAFRCLHLHAEHDIEHLEELRTTITALPLTGAGESLIATSAFATLQGLVTILEDLAARQEPLQD
jgi:hypothetical protein